MVDNNDTSQQQKFIDDQNFDIDLSKIYSAYIKEIDNIRSYVSIVDSKNKIDLQAKDIGEINTAVNQIDIIPQESRVNAFYRLIGLPIINDNNSFYNPGYDIDNISADKKNEKLNIAKNINNKTLTTLLNREKYSQDISKIYSVPDIISSIFLLSSRNTRKFNATVDKNNLNFVIEPKDSSYEIEYTSAGVLKTDYRKYVAEDATTTVITKQRGLDLNLLNPANATRYHFIRPLMVDPRVEFSIRPYTNQMCVPFVKDKSKTIIISQDVVTKGPVYLKKPLLEKIYIDRYSFSSKLGSIGETFTQAKDYAEDNYIIFSNDFLSKIYNDPTTPVAVINIFNNYLNIIKNMLSRLNSALNDLDKAENLYCYVPVVDSRGIEYGITTRNIVLNDPNKTKEEINIVNKSVKNLVNKITPNITQEVNDEGFAFSEISSLTDPANSDAFGNVNEEDLASLLAKRNNICSKAGKALQDIEVILGESGGIGLCDIISMYLALYLLEDEYFIDLFDQDCLNRLKSSGRPELLTVVANNRLNGKVPDPKLAIQKLEQKITEIYNLMDNIFGTIRIINS